MRHFLIIAVLALSAPLAQAQDAAPMSDEARALFREGLALFEARDYEGAIATFEKAYELDPRPELLYAMAQAERLSGDCVSAVILYRGFLDSDPPEQHAAVARKGLEQCERALASRPAGVAEPEPEPEPDAEPVFTPDEPATGPEPGVTRSDGRRPPWYEDKVGGALLGAGVLGLALGGVYYAKSSSDVSAAGDAGGYDEYVDLMDRAESRRSIAWVGIGAGSALVTAAALRYWVFRGDPESPAVAVSADQDAVGVSATIRF